MKGCLRTPGSSKPCTPPMVERPNMERKSVSFFGSSDEEEEMVEVHVADDWDRTPCQVTPKLTYKDIVELYELKASAPRSSPNRTTGYDTRSPTFCKRVPVALLPTYENSANSSSYATPSSNSHKPATPEHTSSFATAPPTPPQPPEQPPSPPKTKMKFLPLMPTEDESQSPLPSAPPSPPQIPARSGLKNFQFLPIYHAEPEPPSDDDDSHDHHDGLSTPSLTSSSIDSTPSTPSESSSPSLTPSASTSDSYFDLSYQQPLDLLHQPTSIRKSDFLRMNEASSHREGSSSPIRYPLAKKLTLTAMPSPALLPPSPFDLQESLLKAEKYLQESAEAQDRLGDGQFGRRKGYSHRFTGAGSGNDMEDLEDETFFSFETTVGGSPSSAEGSPSGLRSPSPMNSLA